MRATEGTLIFFKFFLARIEMTDSILEKIDVMVESFVMR